MVILGGLGSDLGRGDGRVALVRQHLGDPRRAQRRACPRDLGPRLRPSPSSRSGSSASCSCDDGAATRGPAARAEAQDRAHGGHREPVDDASIPRQRTTSATPKPPVRGRRGGRNGGERRCSSAQHHQDLRRPGGRRQRRVVRDPAPVDRLDHRPQRRREDHLLQHAHRALQAHLGHGSASTGKDITGQRPDIITRWAWRARSRTSACSPR